MNTDLPANLLEKFECQRCNECCKQPGFVYLKDGEAERIAAFLKMEVYQFTEQYCEVQDRQWLVLKKKNGETCRMLQEGKDGGCSIHPVKPEQCRAFPVRWRTVKSLSYCAGLRKLQETNG